MEGLRFVRKIRKILFENPVNTQWTVSNEKKIIVFIDIFSLCRGVKKGESTLQTF